MLPHFYDAMAPSLAEEDLNANFTREAGSFENIAVNSILRGSQWTETFKAPAPPSQHINVKEARALTTAVSRECTQLLGGKPGGSRRRDRRCRQDDPLVAQARRQLSKPNYASAGHTSHRQAQLGGKLFLSVLFMVWCPPCWSFRQSHILDPGGHVAGCSRGLRDAKIVPKPI